MTQNTEQSARTDTGRLRKAWRAQIIGIGDDFGTLVYAPTAGKARYQRLLDTNSDRVTFAEIRISRSRQDDKVLPIADEAIATLSGEQRSALTHTLENGRFYTSTEDKTLCSLVQLGLARNTGRGWNDGEAYFVLTNAGRTAALSLTPLYPEYPEYRA